MKHLLTPISLLFAGAALFGGSMTFTADDTAYDYSDASAWTVAPGTNDRLVITGTGTTGSSLNMTDDATSAWNPNYHNITLNDATFNITDSNFDFGFGGSPMTVDNASILLQGASALNVTNTVTNFKDFGFIMAAGSSVATFKNMTFGGTYVSLQFHDSSKLVLDNSTYNKNAWGGIFVDGSSELEIKNGASFNINGNWGGNDTMYLKDNAALNINSGAVFNTGSDYLYISSNAAISVDGTNSRLTLNHGFTTDPDVEAVANYSMTVSNGGTIVFTGGAAANTFTGTSTLTVSGAGSSVSGAFALSENASAIFTDGATATLTSGLSLNDSTTMTIQKGAAESAPSVSLGGTFTGDDGAVLNLTEVAASRSSNTVISGGLKVQVTDSTFNIGSGNPGGWSGTQYFVISDGASVVLDNSVLSQGSYGAIQLTDGAVFKMQNGSTVAYGNYRSFDVSGASQVIMDGAGTVYDGNFWQTSNFVDDSKLVVSNGATFAVTGRHSGEGIIFSDSAAAEVTGGSTLSTNQNAYVFIFNGNSTLAVSGAGSKVTGPITLNDNAAATVSDGATMDLSNITINDSASVNVSGDLDYGSASIAPKGTSAVVNIKDSTFNRTYANAITVSGANAENGATVNFIDSTYAAGHNQGMIITSDANVVFDNSVYRTLNFPYVTVTDSSMTFQNGSDVKGSNKGFFYFRASGSQVVIKDSNTSFDVTHYNGLGSSFSDGSTFTVSDGATVSFADIFGGAAVVTSFDSSTFNVVGGSTFLQNRSGSSDGVSLDNASAMNVSGASTVRLSATTVSSDSSLKVSGVGNTVQTGALSFAGTLMFESDASGISTITASSVADFTGKLYIDMSTFGGPSLTTTLIESASAYDWSDYVASADTSFVEVVKANEGDSWQTFIEGNNLIFNYVAVPEASTCATILGALALAFALMRRRARK